MFIQNASSRCKESNCQLVKYIIMPTFGMASLTSIPNAEGGGCGSRCELKLSSFKSGYNSCQIEVNNWMSNKIYTTKQVMAIPISGHGW